MVLLGNTVVFDCGPILSGFVCFLLASLYVGSLYIKSDVKCGRDHPQQIKARFVRVSTVCLIVLPLLWICSSSAHTVKSRDIFTWLGLRIHGFLLATLLPLLLTMVLFAGPLALHYIDGIWSLYFDRHYWSSNIRNLIWLRNHVVGPLTEEFVFRACMLPLLVPSFGEYTSIFLCPIFFGLAHLHHIREKLKEGVQLKYALINSGIQFGFTTVFGIYSAFLFLRTGHFIAPAVAHSFCNHMGFPNFQEVFAHETPLRYCIMAAFVGGLVLWALLLFPLTDPTLYGNTLYFS